MVIPIYLDHLIEQMKKNYFTLDHVDNNPEMLFLSIAPLISNITMPYRLKNIVNNNY